jgi:hypothetical protein
MSGEETVFLISGTIGDDPDIHSVFGTREKAEAALADLDPNEGYQIVETEVSRGSGDPDWRRRTVMQVMAKTVPVRAFHQKIAINALIRMALTNGPTSKTTEPLNNATIVEQLGSNLTKDEGRKVAEILVMLAGKAVAEDGVWNDLLEGFKTREGAQ